MIIAVPARNRIEDFESRLTPFWFIFLLLLLLLLNIIVFYFIFFRPVHFVLPAQSELIRGLVNEKQRLEGLLIQKCDHPDIAAYSRGEVGPVPTAPGVPQSSDATEQKQKFYPVAPSPRASQSEAIHPPGSNESPQTPSKHEVHQSLDKKSTSTSLKTPEQLNTQLQASTVRVLLPNSVGSGFFINSQTILTNRHVIEGAESPHVFVASKELGSAPLRATIVSMTKDSKFFNPDLALLRLDRAVQNAVSLPIANDPIPLQSIIAAGYPYVSTRTDTDRIIPNLVLTTGEVSVLQAQSNGSVWIIHTAQISPGSSGGSLINRCGEVVGVNTLIGTGANPSDGRSLYALSASSTLKFLDGVGERYQRASGSCSTLPR